MSVELINQKIDEAFEGASDNYSQKLRVALKEAINEIFNTIDTGAPPSGMFVFQGNYDPTYRNTFPTGLDCLNETGPVLQGYCWKILENAEIFGIKLSIGDYVLANNPNGSNATTIEDWDILKGVINYSDNLIAELENYNPADGAMALIPIKNMANFIPTHATIKLKEGAANGLQVYFTLDDMVLSQMSVKEPNPTYDLIIPFQEYERHLTEPVRINIGSNPDNYCILQIRIYGYQI